MSSVLDPTMSTAPAQLLQTATGLNIIGQQDQANVFVVNGEGNDSIAGGNEADLIKGGLGSDIISGRDGDDTLFGGDGGDVLRGGEGADLLNGGKGADFLTGGEGDDTFEFFADDLVNGEIDVITDFSEEGPIEDQILLRGIGTDAVVEYDENTGLISVNGQDIIQIDKNRDVTIRDTDGDGDWELF